MFALAACNRFSGPGPAGSGGLPYRDPALSVDRRVEDLLARMTPEEKFRQLFMVAGDLDAGTEAYRDGIFGLQVRSATDARSAAEKLNAIQKFFVEKTRLGIPVAPFEEALHGLVAPGATAFPQAIGLAAAWDPELMAGVAGAIAAETRSRGIRQVLSPVVNIARDVRWGRVEETYGEDPYLASRLAVAFVRAFEERGVVATPKHFVANVGAGGRDSYPVADGERYLREVDFPPFLAAIREGGARSIMTAYNSWDGLPCSMHPRLLAGILKGEWGFRGFVISDACSVGGAYSLHGIADSYPESGRQAWESGLDVVFQTEIGHAALFAPAITAGRVGSARIDDAVRRVLRAKMEIGLFEEPYADPEAAARTNGAAAHRALARQAARDSLVLLKNRAGTLPLRTEGGPRAIAVIGPDAVEARLGGYSGPGLDKVTLFDGIRDRAGKAAAVRYAAGCGRKDDGGGEAAIEAAARLARGSDLAVVAAGIEEGEARDRSDIRLPGRQAELIRRVAATGAPTVVVLYGGSAVAMSEWLDAADAVLLAWYPGEEGGRAVADVLWGDADPAGRLPITFPLAAGQLPLVYNHKPTGRFDGYADLPGDPLFPFGFGLSYTEFRYADLTIEPGTIAPGGMARVSCEIANVGQRAGAEVAQLYIRDALASVVRPVLELKSFRKVRLEPGASTRVVFEIGPKELALLDAAMKETVEPGGFQVYVGRSSRDLVLQGLLTVR
ncbi:MAG TPA: glycoside hydrolase family 3 N-terminal domain-containing protein [Candidatus Aminicenantes bacterium]|nr:glycoside hydrolase family 3 N-terminal domain-containing protein [Candidatus Aminicenantes bacterium]HRY63930.1 glycoside hydrolase family 3 N-terminal domain-containing protein [Candidatus Aminicenantes bacterium]HRZ70843.1 glycoside hydrolase family 3 N-terminal domain-containing protein [Candidatus Aminicenantes bacterium]